MKNKTKMKIISICFIFIIIFNITGNVYAAINDEYGRNDPVVEVDLEEKLTTSVILDAIASLVYGLGSLVESLVGSVFEQLTGENMFPWADKIIFNTIPFLDVNFLNPAEGSLFLTSNNEDTILAKIIRNTYYTILTLAIGFLGVIVGIMAIRLAVSTIASEKAKYKEAIGNFLISLIMLFCVHYALSFAFYLNETIVTMASTLLLDSMKDVEIDSSFLASSISDEQLIENFFTVQGAGDKDAFENERNKIFSEDAQTRDSNIKIMKILIQNPTYKEIAIPKAYGNGKVGLGEKINTFFGWDNKSAVDTVMDHIEMVKNNGKIEEFKKELEKFNKGGIADYEEFVPKEIVDQMVKDKYGQGLGGAQGTDFWKKDDPSNYKWSIKNLARKYAEFLRVMITANSVYNGNNEVITTDTLIAKMGEYFKQAAWTYEKDDEGVMTGWSPTQPSLQGALLYAIFIVQSMLYFFAYIKRFFYVIILSLLAPVMVIYDFLGKVVMKKGVIIIVIKELGSLIFTQSVQAFLLSNVMVIILTTAIGSANANAEISVSATGVICIVALTSLSKIELLVKKLIGIGSQFGDPSMNNGAKDFAKTFIAAKLAGRVVNNAGKMAGGAKDMFGAGRTKATAAANYARGLAKLNAGNGDAESGATSTNAGTGTGTNANSAQAPSLTNSAVSGAVAGSAAAGSLSNSSGGSLNINPSNLNINAGNVKLDGKNISNDKKEELKNKYEEAIEKANAQRRQGVYKAISGVAETGGALVGGTAGAIYGLAQGDGALQNAGMGMGIGDAIAEKVVGTVQVAHDFTIDVGKTIDAKSSAVASTSNLTGKDISSYRNAVKELEKYADRLDEVNKSSSNINAGNA